jgi:2'-5' RNA ligase
MTRTFIALELNTMQQRHLAGVIRQVAPLLPSVRWVDPAGIHLTLAFLGELSDGELAGAIHATETAARRIPPFSYRFTQIGAFGSPRQPRVLWLGIDEPSGMLQQLHRILNRELVRRNFEIDQRPFSPHLTLARLKAPLPPDEQQQLQTLLNSEQPKIKPSGSYDVQAVSVMKSELLRTGAQYTCLRECKLSGQV